MFEFSRLSEVEIFQTEDIDASLLFDAWKPYLDRVDRFLVRDEILMPAICEAKSNAANSLISFPDIIYVSSSPFLEKSNIEQDFVLNVADAVSSVTLSELDAIGKSGLLNQEFIIQTLFRKAEHFDVDLDSILVHLFQPEVFSLDDALNALALILVILIA
jgi:hypothetical protein